MSKDEKSNYYDAGDLETIDIIKAKLTPEQLTGFYLGNAIKYSCRLNFKGCADRDAEKLANYSKWLATHSGTPVIPEQSEYQDMDYIAKICGGSGNV